MAAGVPDVNAGLASPRVRAAMVERIRTLGVKDPRVLAALDAVPRHAFVDAALASRAYEDTALPIGAGQTISQPYIVARSAELALDGVADARAARVLEIGTGCGYAAAVLARLFGSVVSIERVKALHELARANLRPFRIAHLRLVFGDGTEPVPGEAPFDAVIAAAAGAQLPPAWIAQLAPNGRIVAPVGVDVQTMVVVIKDSQGRLHRRTVEPVRFVPLKPGTA